MKKCTNKLTKSQVEFGFSLDNDTGIPNTYETYLKVLYDLKIPLGREISQRRVKVTCVS